MDYEHVASTPPGRDAAARRQIRLMVLLALGMRLPARVLAVAGRLPRVGGRASLARQVASLVAAPDAGCNTSVIDWTLAYGNPAILGRLIESLAGCEPGTWKLELMKRANARLLLPREHTVPVFQRATVSSAPRTALVCFTGNALKLNIPVHLLHCAVADRFDTLVYLRDPAKRNYRDGIPGIAGSMDGLVQALRQRIPPGCRVSVLATSGGGPAAAYAANALGAYRLALMSPGFKFNGEPAAPVSGLERLDGVRLYFARHSRVDNRLANNWKTLVPESCLHWLDSDSHGTLKHLAAKRGLDELLHWLAGVGPEAGACPGGRCP